MANININKQPSYLSAGENPMIIELGTDVTGSTEQYSLTTITVQSGVTQGDFLIFTLTFPVLQSVRLQASNTPTLTTDFLTSGFTFNFTPITFTPDQIATSIGTALRSSILISTYYTTWVVGNVIYIKAKIPNQRFCLAETTIVPETNNILTTSDGTKLSINVLEIGQAKYVGDLMSRYSMWVDLFIDDNNQRVFTNDEPLSGMSYVNTVSRAWQYGVNAVDFDLSNTLKPYTVLPDPTYSTGFTGKFDKWIRNYKVQYGDYDLIAFENIAVILAGFPNTLRSLKGTIDDLWVTPSSLPYVSGNTLAEYYSGGTGGRSLPLTLSPSNKPVFINQSVEYIYFINKYQTTFTGSTYSLSVNVDYTYIDGSTDSQSNLIIGGYTGITGENSNGLWRVNVAPQEVGIDSFGYHNGFLVSEYVVKIIANGTQIVEDKSFVIEEIQPKTGFDCLWLNELGVHDNFYFGGNITSTIQRDTKDMLKNVPYDYPEGFEYDSQYDTQATDVYTITSSFVDENIFDWLKSILKSNKVYVIENKKSNYFRIVDFGYEKNTVENKYSVQITIQRTIADNNVSI